MYGRLALLLVVGVAYVTAKQPALPDDDDEHAIFAHLFDNEDTHVHPHEHGLPTNLLVDCAITRLDEVNVHTQQIKFDSVCLFNWTDDRFAWDLATTGVEHVIVDTEDIWTPDLTMVDGDDADYHAYWKSHWPHARVHYNGEVEWVVPHEFHAYCHIAMPHLETDDIVCELEFISWYYDNAEVLMDWYEDHVHHENNPQFLAEHQHHDFNNDYHVDHIEYSHHDTDSGGHVFRTLTMKVHLARQPHYEY